MIQCNRCSLQYIGETKRCLKDRFNEHRRSVDKTNTKSKPTTVAEHFLSHPNHCHTDMQLIPLELIHSSRDSIRKARESFLIDLARTLEPPGMNRLMNRKTCNLRKPFLSLKGVSFQRNCGAASVGVLQDNLVLSTELIM